MAAHYFLGNRLLGSSPQAPWWDDAKDCISSVAFICPTCGDVWGRVAMDGLEWTSMRRGCEKHPWLPGDIGGTFLPNWLHRYEHLPEAVLQREFQLHLQLYPQQPNESRA